ncbi:MAG: hypothetical protein JSS87_06370 [Acidobacteria bacterium]|nr:hypothetical protein [Acidobacteriota bacterium]
MSSRRDFVKLAAGAAAVQSFPSMAFAGSPGTSFAQPSKSAYMNVVLQDGSISFLAVDSLGKNKVDTNMLAAPSTRNCNATISGWGSGKQEHSFSLYSSFTKESVPRPLTLEFTIDSHATLLGLFNETGQIKLPALLHFPAHGTLRITSPQHGLALDYDAKHTPEESFIRVTFPAATAEHKSVEYNLEVTAIYPAMENKSIANDPRFDGYRRDFLSMLQLNPRRRALANNVASDTCAFTVFEYSAMAVELPLLAPGLSAVDILRQTLDRYIGGMKAYGMVGYNDSPVIKWDFLDTYPSLLMACADYVRASNDTAWVKRNWSVLKTWADKMISYDTDGDGLLEYPLSGNSGSWPEKMTARPANWWDTIGFAHKDAYSNALAYKAFEAMQMLAEKAGTPHQVEDYRKRAQQIKAIYYKTFYNPATGVLAGWKSADGKLHDYYFLFVNGMAVTYGLVTQQQGNAIWDKLMAKMKEVGYTNFAFGLPGNLIPVRKEDYVDSRNRFGGSKNADGSDGFQIYENGGATACYAYYTIQAMRTLGRNKEADAILYPLIQSFEDGRFQGRGPNGMTYDWMTWDGKPHGYEGLLVDGYLTLLAAVPSQRKTT